MLVHWLWLFYLFWQWENCSKYGSPALKIQQNFQVLFVGRIVAREIPVLWLISLMETSFSYAKNVMYACSSALKVRVKWNSQMFTTGYLNQERQTSWFSCHQLLCCHLFPINYLLFCEMYEIYKEQIYVPAVNAQNLLFQSNTILDKTTWENVFINAHYLTQQNYFQIHFSCCCLNQPIIPQHYVSLF